MGTNYLILSFKKKKKSEPAINTCKHNVRLGADLENRSGVGEPMGSVWEPWGNTGFLEKTLKEEAYLLREFLIT